MIRRRLDLSPVEWEIMQVIWKSPAPLTVREVLEAAYPHDPPAYTTVQTVMNNLATRKKILRRTKVGPVNVYEAAVSHEHIRGRSLETLAQWLFHGSFGSMASYLVTSGRLNAAEIARLRQVLDDTPAPKRETPARRKGGRHS